MKYYIDFETRSALDLTIVGASRYSRHPSTSILCVAIKRENDPAANVIFDMFEFRRWFACFGPADTLVAHNAFFERMLWKNILVKRFGFPEVPISQWSCTMAKCLNHGLPRSLAQAAEALGLLQQKDSEGRRLMLKMCVPNGSNAPEDMAKLGRYCFQDNVVAEQIDQRLPELCAFERRVWELDQKINDRGIVIDLPLINQVMGILAKDEEALLKEFKTLVGGELSSPRQNKKLKEWVDSQLGVESRNMDKNTVATLLARGVPENVRRVLEIRQALSKSSTAKYRAMLETVDDDGRIRGHLIYHAAHTGRWGGTLSQLQNLPRPKHDVNLILGSLPQAGVLWPMLFKNCFAPASSLVRSVLIPEKGKQFICSDFAGIEARVTAWLAGQEDKLELFRSGGDAYLHAASGIYGRAITKADADERQVGKISELALGFGGGISAYQSMCAAYGISLVAIAQNIIDSATEEELSSAEFVYGGYKAGKRKANEPFFTKLEGMAADIIKQRWRKAHPKIVELWGRTEIQAINAVQNPGKRFMVCEGIYWRYDRENDFLNLELPCRDSKYFKPRVQPIKNKFGKQKDTLTYVGVDSITKRLTRFTTYGGELVENMVQAISRDIMVEAAFNVDAAGIPTVLTTHDELLTESTEDAQEAELKVLMLQPKDWMMGLPLDASTWSGYRYRK